MTESLIPVHQLHQFPNPHVILPPIILYDRDREFLLKLNSYIDDELSKAKDKHNPEQRFQIYKAAFDQIIEFVVAYKPLLTAIKAEYEECIDVILRGQKEAFFLSGKLKAMASEPSTLRNYRKRIDELEIKTGKLRTENISLKANIESKQKKVEVKDTASKATDSEQANKSQKDNRILPGLTLAQSTNLDVLTEALERVERQYKELTISHRTRYLPKQKQLLLKEHLFRKVTERDEIMVISELFKLRNQRLKVAVEAALSYIKFQPPHHTIGDAVIRALTKQVDQSSAEKGDDMLGRLTPGATFDEDDPSREKEAEMMLEYIEKFNELLEDKKYEEAAVHAANSPKGILRTPETMNRFKDVNHNVTSLGRSPLLAFCDSFMSTVPAYGQCLSESMSLSCAQVALNENRLDLLTHWLSQNRLTLSAGLAELIRDYTNVKPQTTKQCMALAQKVFSEIGKHMDAFMCMIEQDRVTQALGYADKHLFSMDDYTHVIREYPSHMKLVLALAQTSNNDKTMVPFGVILTVLIEQDNEKLATCLLKEYSPSFGPSVEKQQSLQKLISKDIVTSEEQWVAIIDFFNRKNCPRFAMNLQAARVVQDVTKKLSTNLDFLFEDDPSIHDPVSEN